MASSLDDFSELLGRVRTGDAEAANEIVGRYASIIRVAIGARLTDPRLRRQFDSADVCQSVFASFFLHVAAGAYDLEEPAQLAAMLVQMAKNKLAMRVRLHHRKCRDVRRSSNITETSLASKYPEPSRSVAGKELLDRALAMMSPEIRDIAEKRIDGVPWSDIADSIGGTAQGRRKQYERAVRRIADALDLATLQG